MLAPIVIFVYNRLDHTQNLIQSLVQNPLSAQSEVFVFSDAAKNEIDREKVRKVREYIASIEQQNLFAKIKVRYAEKNRGLADSVINGVSEVIHKYGKVIVLEDDLILAPSFLEFMNQCLDKYEAEKRVFSVSGFTRNIPYLQKLDIDMYFSCRAQSWGWATWVDRWDTIDWDIKDYNKFKWDFAKRRAFNAGGNDMASMLDRQQCGRINSWAIRFCYGQFKQNGYTVQPRLTLVQNKGQDGSGTHCNFVREMADLSTQSRWNLRNVEYDTQINAELKSTRKKIPFWKLLGSYCAFVLGKGKFKI